VLLNLYGALLLIVVSDANVVGCLQALRTCYRRLPRAGENMETWRETAVAYCWWQITQGGREREKRSLVVAALGCWRTQSREEGGVVSPCSEIDCWLLGDVAPQPEVGIVVLVVVITE